MKWMRLISVRSQSLQRLPQQAAGYLVVGGLCTLVNLALFAVITSVADVWIAAPMAFVLASGLNYVLCATALFRGSARWSMTGRLSLYAGVVVLAGSVDSLSTVAMIAGGVSPLVAKVGASGLTFVVNFAGRRWLVFSEAAV
jgi:putative flippase GtrA